MSIPQPVVSDHFFINPEYVKVSCTSVQDMHRNILPEYVTICINILLQMHQLGKDGFQSYSYLTTPSYKILLLESEDTSLFFYPHS